MQEPSQTTCHACVSCHPVKVPAFQIMFQQIRSTSIYTALTNTVGLTPVDTNHALS